MAPKTVVRMADVKRVIKAATESWLTVREIVLTGEEVSILFGSPTDREDAGPVYDDSRIEKWTV